jgi:asparagine synthase (glutamine-hydrolysing)
MCGIFGVFTNNLRAFSHKRLSIAFDALHHRGPNDHGLCSFAVTNGTLFFGHTRLSIIDLSPGGHQPMQSANDRYTIVFNGEVYNYRELRQELQVLGHTFHSDSDTEVLLACWTQWGADCLKRMLGMFAFAVFDKQTECVTLVRDAFGIKPLFFAHTDFGLVFASEMGALLSLLDVDPEPNAQRAYDYLIHQVQDSGFDTFVKGVHHVPPAHWLKVNLSQTKLSSFDRWWNPSIRQTSTLTFEDAAECLRELFLDSVKLHLRSDVPLGVALSGGVDSSAIACAVRHLEPGMELHTFSFIAESSNHSEEPWIDLINGHVNAIPHKVSINPNDLNTDISDLIDTQGEPFCTTSMYAQYRVFRAAREAGITVVLEGQGADELLAGYQGYQGQRMRSLLELRDLFGMTRFARQWRQWPGRERHSPWRSLLGQILPDNLYRATQSWVGIQTIPEWMDSEALKRLQISTRPARLARTPEARGRRVAEVLLRSMREDGLPSLLRYGDRNAMRFSIENRVPFLTLPIAEFVLSLPEDYLIAKDGETKSVFRAAMRGIVPDAVLDRRDKVGFETPMGDWVREGLISQTSKQESRLVSGLDFIKPNELRAILAEVVDGKRLCTPKDWRLINLMVWANQIPSWKIT